MRFAWCLDSESKLVMQMTLLSIGLCNEPAGAWLISCSHWLPRDVYRFWWEGTAR
jgi:hypothetical protein